MSWFNDFIGRFSQETKPRPQKLANIIDRLTPALVCIACCWQDYEVRIASLQEQVDRNSMMSSMITFDLDPDDDDECKILLTLLTPQGLHWQPIRDPFELTSPTQHASRPLISFWNFLA